MGFKKILKCSSILRKCLRLESSVNRHWIHVSKLSYNKSLNEAKIAKRIFEKNKAYLYKLPRDRFSISFELYCDCFKRVINVSKKISDTVDSVLEVISNKVNIALEEIKVTETFSKDFAKREVNPILLHWNESLHHVTVESILNFGRDGDYKLKVIDNDYTVVVNSPWINSLKIPSTALVECPYLPYKFDAVNTNKDESTFLWFKSENKPELSAFPMQIDKWIECGSEFVYLVKKEDIGHQLLLKCYPKNGSLIGAALEIPGPIVLDLPENIPFEKRHEYTKIKSASDEIRIVSYNMLAHINSKTKKTIYSYCEPKFLSMSYRKHLLIKEILGYNADLICLQEIPNGIFHFDLKDLLSKRGLEGEYFGNQNVQGLALFYDINKFEKLKLQDFVLINELVKNNLLKDIYSRIEKNNKLLTRLHQVGTTLQILVLKSLIKESELIVLGNTHLYYHPDCDHVRLLQGVLCLKLMQNITEIIANENPDKNINIIMCGDFNSTPERGIHQLMTKGFIESDHVDWKCNAEEKIENLSLSHSFKIESACGIPKYTNYTLFFKACLDYIYYQTDRLEVKRTVPFPAEEELRRKTAMPSAVFPSDHLALIADLKWKF